MSGEILSGIFGGLIAPVVSKLLGKFKLWKVFVSSLILIYVAIFLIGSFYVGPKQAFVELWQFVQPHALLIFCGISASAALVAFLGRDAIQRGSKKED
jgi:hypothetical protein